MAYFEIFIAIPCVLLGSYGVIDSLRNPESDVHGFGLLGGILLLGFSAVLLMGGLGLLWLRRRRWILHLPLLLWIFFLVALEYGWVH